MGAKAAKRELKLLDGENKLLSQTIERVLNSAAMGGGTSSTNVRRRSKALESQRNEHIMFVTQSVLECRGELITELKALYCGEHSGVSREM